jgi:DNA (cytosine-5)-methyltransferase 1
MYTMGSLFAGIGGFDLGFERAGFKTVWQVEIDPYCQKVLAKNFPEAERFGDIRECGRHNLKPVDVICGGFPCQDISNAGKRAGIKGERSGLWSEHARIIRELRPKYVVVENVAALLGRGMGVVLGDLAEIGYDAEWEVISASDVGAPHERERVWITAYPASERCGPWPERRPSPSLTGKQQPALQETSDPQKVLRPKIFGKQQDRNLRRYWRLSWRQYLETIRGMDDGVPGRVDGLAALGNSLVPQIPQAIAERIKEALDS